MFPCYLVILESQPSLNSEGVDASSSSLTSCRNKEPGCAGSPARESAGGTTCHACRGKCLRVYPDPPACSHPPRHAESTRHTQADLRSMDSSSQGTLCFVNPDKGHRGQNEIFWDRMNI